MLLSFSGCTTEGSCSSEDKEEDYRKEFLFLGVVCGCPPLPGKSPGGSVCKAYCHRATGISEVLLVLRPALMKSRLSSN